MAIMILRTMIAKLLRLKPKTQPSLIGNFKAYSKLDLELYENLVLIYAVIYIPM